jgi:hypothetical protein
VAGLTLFKNQTHQEVWVEMNCHRCFQPQEAQRRIQGKDTICPILNRALTSGRKPREWDRTRSDEMAKSIRCNAFQARPPRVKFYGNTYEQDSIFDVDDLHHHGFVPVDGWPDRPGPNEVDHQ